MVNCYQDLRYDYEVNGNVWNIYDNTVATNAGDQHFSYDDLDRLTLANGPYGASGINSTFSYSYDEIGDLLSNTQVGTYIYPTSGPSSVRPHAVSTAGANSYAYDPNGNLLSATGPGLNRTLTYNADNMPATITNGGQTTQFIYNGDANRVKKIVGSTTTRYISSLYECDNANCTRFIFAGSQRVASIASNGAIHYWHGDHLGSSSVITDITGAKVQAITYYPFGGTRTNQSFTAPSVDVPYKFTDQEFDNSTGLYDYGARHYDPILGRFISPDTIIPEPANPQDFNRYSYVRNNPTGNIDPSGNYTVEQVRNIPGITQTLTDWNRDGRLNVWDINVRLAQGALTQGQYNALVPLYNWNSQFEFELLNISGVWPILTLFPGASDPNLNYGGNRIAEYQKELAKLQPTPTPTPTPPAPKPVVPAPTNSQFVNSIFEQAQQDMENFSPFGAGVGALNVLKAAQLAKNKIAGDMFRDLIAKLMKNEGRQVQTEVTKNTPFGKRVMDLEVSKDGKVLGGIETKTGNSPYIPAQRAKDEWLRQNGYPVNVVRDR